MDLDRRCIHTKQKFKLICLRGAASPKISVLTLIIELSKDRSDRLDDD